MLAQEERPDGLDRKPREAVDPFFRDCDARRQLIQDVHGDRNGSLPHQLGLRTGSHTQDLRADCGSRVIEQAEVDVQSSVHAVHGALNGVRRMQAPGPVRWPDFTCATFVQGKGLPAARCRDSGHVLEIEGHPPPQLFARLHAVETRFRARKHGHVQERRHRGRRGRGRTIQGPPAQRDDRRGHQGGDPPGQSDAPTAGSKGVPEIPGALPPLFRIQRERLLQGRPRGHGNPAPIARYRRSPHRPACSAQRFVQHQAQRIEVGSRGGPRARDLLRRHVGGRAGPSALRGQRVAGRLLDLNDPEVRQQKATVDQEHVRRLDVSVHHPRGMHALQGIEQVPPEAKRVAPVEGAALQSSSQALAIDQVHHVIEEAVVLIRVVDGDDVGVGERGQGAGLAEEPGLCRRRRHVRTQHLDRDQATERRVESEEDRRHAA